MMAKRHPLIFWGGLGFWLGFVVLEERRGKWGGVILFEEYKYVDKPRTRIFILVFSDIRYSPKFWDR